MEKPKTCEECDAKCCKHIAVEIDVPESLDDFEDVKWFVCHENINIFVDEDNEWYLEVLNKCEHLGEGNKCKIYGKRPAICTDYNHEECVFYNNYEEKYTFKKIEDVEDYVGNVFNKGLHELPEEGEEEDEEG